MSEQKSFNIHSIRFVVNQTRTAFALHELAAFVLFI